MKTYRQAKDTLLKIQKWNQLINKLATPVASLLPVCQHAKKRHHWSHVLVDLLWIDCPCCFGFRWLLLGMIGGSVVGFIIGVL